MGIKRALSKRVLIAGCSIVVASLTSALFFHSPALAAESTPPTIKYDNQDVDFGPYMSDLQKRVKSSWHTPRLYCDEIKVTVIFKIKADGTILDPQMKTSSGNKDADESAMRTLAEIKLRPLPAGAPATVDIEFTFTATGRKTEAQLRESIAKLEKDPQKQEAVLQDLLALADELAYQKRSAETESTATRALSLCEKINGPTSPKTIDARSILLVQLHVDENWQPAIALHQKQISILEKEKDSNSRLIAETMGLADCYLMTKNDAAALPVLKRAAELKLAKDPNDDLVDIRHRLVDINKEWTNKKTVWLDERLLTQSDKRAASEKANFAEQDRLLAEHEKSWRSDDPRLVDEWIALADASRALGKDDPADLQHCEQLYRKALNGTRNFGTAQQKAKEDQVLAKLGNMCSSNGKAKEAMMYFEESLKLRKAKYTKTNAQLISQISLMANGYERLGDLRRAVELLSEIVDAQQDSLSVRRQLLFLYSRLNESHKAVAFLKRHLPDESRSVLLPTDIEELQDQLAELYLKTGKTAEAENVYRDRANVFEKSNPGEQAHQLVGLASVQCREKNYKAAEQTLQNALVIRSSLGEADTVTRTLVDLATVAETDARQSEAEDYLKKAVSLAEAKRPGCDLGYAIDHLACFYWSRKDYARAIPLLQKEGTLSSPPPGQPSRLAWLYFDAQKLPEAVKTLENRTPKTKPADSLGEIFDPLQEIASMYQQVNKPKEACSYLERAVEQSHNDSQPSLSLFRIYLQQGEYGKAAPVAAKAEGMAVDPLYNEKSGAEDELALCDFKLGKLKSAEQSYRKMLDRSSTDDTSMGVWVPPEIFDDSDATVIQGATNGTIGAMKDGTHCQPLAFLWTYKDKDGVDRAEPTPLVTTMTKSVSLEDWSASSCFEGVWIDQRSVPYCLKARLANVLQAEGNYAESAALYKEVVAALTTEKNLAADLKTLSIDVLADQQECDRLTSKH